MPMTKLFFNLVLTLVLTLELVAQFQGQAQAGEPFKVLTYNIRYENKSDGQDIWPNRRETVVKTIAQADLVGLQEVVASQFDYVVDNTQGWSWYGIGRSDGIRGGEMAAVGWRNERFIAVEQGTFWLSENPFAIGKPAWDAALPRVASWVRLVDRQTVADEVPSTLLLINAHFDHKGQKARTNSGSQIRRWVNDNRQNSHVVFLGDLNAKIDSPPLKQLIDPSASDSPPLVDSKGLCPIADPGPDSTWNGFSKIETGNRIDHVLLQSDRLSVQSFQTLDPRTPSGRFGSDHLPILVELTWRTQANKRE